MFKSQNNLEFETAEHHIQIDDLHHWMKFRVGTCEGLWCSGEGKYCILAIINNNIGNGHFTDVIQWFENSCKRDSKDLIIMEVWNERLKKHLINKLGFKCLGEDDVIKRFKK